MTGSTDLLVTRNSFLLGSYKTLSQGRALEVPVGFVLGHLVPLEQMKRKPL